MGLTVLCNPFIIKSNEIRHVLITYLREQQHDHHKCLFMHDFYITYVLQNLKSFFMRETSYFLAIFLKILQFCV